MEERFSGFRFSIGGDDGLRGAGVKEMIQRKADELFCFGWVQDSKTSIVGEARCHKKLGHKMKLYLVGLKNETSIEETIIKEYRDSKIKLHFSHFKILVEDRITCFRNQPHQCEDLSIPLW
jgi:hypothetical protein